MTTARLALAFLVLAAGCGDDAAPGAGDLGGMVQLDGGMDGGLDGGGNDADAGRDLGPELDAGGPAALPVLYLGRHDAADPSAVRFSWPGSGFAFRFRGTGASVRMRGGSFFTVVLDGEERAEALDVRGPQGIYAIVQGLPRAEHTLELFRRTEASNGVTTVTAVSVEGEPLPAPDRPERQLELIGDSWLTAPGVDAPPGDCSGAVENHFRTWGALAARTLGAELSTVAVGGSAVLGDLALAPLYDRVLRGEAGSEGTIQPADVAFVSLGANDLAEGALPEGFVEGYAALLAQVRAQHPGALIACVYPELEGPDTATIRTATDAAIALRSAAGDTRVMGADIEIPALIDLSCDEYHPGPMSYAAMAENAVAFLRDEMGW
ncbi:MAG: GDSL-type esterase/lipase family protein [Myxococcota bacterium]